jgi:hypothetical protein
MESYIYTEKEERMHVTGDKGLVDTTFLRECQGQVGKAFLSEEEKTNFLEKGYMCSRAVINSDAIDEARQYIDRNYSKWLKQTRRQDDWRIHHRLHFSSLHEEIDHPAILNLVLQSPLLLEKIVALLQCPPGGIFYNQVAYRTPLPHDCPEKVLEYTSGAEYHIDGQANAYGTRFPDPWTLLIGVALVDLERTDMGNFTLFPGTHVLDWSDYPNQKKEKTLPDLGEPYRASLRRGDVVICHTLLPHRGGKNTVLKTEMDLGNITKPPDSKDLSFLGFDYTNLPNITRGTREMVFFRIQRSASPGVDGSSVDIFDPHTCDYYYTADRSHRILIEKDIFFEYPGLFL